MPAALYRAFGHIKGAVATVNAELGRLPDRKAEAIIRAARDVGAGRLDDNFPLTIYHSGIGEAFDLNVNEVVANRAIQLLGGRIGTGVPVHPLQDVGMGYGPLEGFLSASRLAIVLQIEETLVPGFRLLVRKMDTAFTRTGDAAAAAADGAAAWPDTRNGLLAALRTLDQSEGPLHEISFAMAGHPSATAERGFAEKIAEIVTASTGKPFVAEPNRSSGPATLIAMTGVMAALRALADATLALAIFAARPRHRCLGPKAVPNRGRVLMT